MSASIALAVTPEEIAACFDVMRELRPHLTPEEFARRVKVQMEEGYHLARLESGGKVRAVTGFRIQHNLVWGRFLYVDDLVTTAEDRSKGHGQALFAWLIERAKSEGCEELHLDSGVQRFPAHRFYLAERMDIVAHHFGIRLR